jgi:hypothetical protein
VALPQAVGANERDRLMVREPEVILPVVERLAGVAVGVRVVVLLGGVR